MSATTKKHFFLAAALLALGGCGNGRGVSGFEVPNCLALDGVHAGVRICQVHAGPPVARGGVVLYNFESQNVSLKGWTLSSDSDVYTFADDAAIDAAQDFYVEKLPFGFYDGETATLRDGTGAQIDQRKAVSRPSQPF